MTAKQKAAKQIQALLTLKATKPSAAKLVDQQVMALRERWGWVGSKLVEVNRPAAHVSRVYYIGRNEVPSLRR